MPAARNVPWAHADLERNASASRISSASQVGKNRARIDLPTNGPSPPEKKKSTAATAKLLLQMQMIQQQQQQREHQLYAMPVTVVRWTQINTLPVVE
jgi:hypothetical protein